MWKDLPPLQKIGPLEAIDFATPSPDGPAIVLFHGFGADAFDLAPLAEELGLRRKFRWLFPQGPKTVDIGGGFSGRAWFNIDMVAHERAATLGRDLSYAEARPPGVNEARDKALGFLKALQVPPGRLILGGFSQGAMLAVELAITLPESPKALVILSGTLADEQNLMAKAPARKGLRYFISHGRSDQLLPYSGSERLREQLDKAGWESTCSDFSGGHEIPGPVLRDLARFLGTL
jgi:phospholipase/carboxylesterase